MKKNDTIRCSNKEEVRRYLKALSQEGYHAVVGGYDGDELTIRITKEGGNNGKNTDRTEGRSAHTNRWSANR